MTVDALLADTTADLPRAGFWRRWLATIIDTIVVMFLFQLLVAVLFALTAGAVQMDSGLFSICTAEKTLPQQALDPPPPHDSNFARTCRFSFFGARTGSTLTVGRITREGTTTTTVEQGYMLDKDGKPIRGTSIDGIAELALLGYLIAMIWKTGRTLGARVLRVRVVDIAAPTTSGIPLHKVIARYLAMTIGSLPLFVVLLYQSAAAGGDADAMFIAGHFKWFTYTGVLAALWGLLLIFQTAAKTDPVYDRLAGTAVLKE
jgi:uncharacterized RDD family membrane protein YckC